jgi:hypothetical protein
VNIYGASKWRKWAARAECAAARVVRSSGIQAQACRDEISSRRFSRARRVRCASSPTSAVSTFTADLARQVRTMLDCGVPGVYRDQRRLVLVVRIRARNRPPFRYGRRVEPIRAAEWKAAAAAGQFRARQPRPALGLDAMPHWRDTLARYLKRRTGAPAKMRLAR